MKFTMKLLILFFGVLLASVANAESPREQLKQMVRQLQSSPSDNALREKVIRLAQELKPAPAVPEEAERFEGRAQFAFKNAKSPADYLDAAKEYEKAIAAAPWVAGYYADLCTIYEKAEKYAEAKKSCEFFLASSPSAQDASDVRKRIAGLEFAIEKVAKQKNQGEEFLRKLDGARFVWRHHDEYRGGIWKDFMFIYEVRGKKIFDGYMITASNEPPNDYDPIGVIHWKIEQFNDGRQITQITRPGYLITGHQFVIPKNDDECQNSQQRCFDEIQTISDDGNKITEHQTVRGQLKEEIFLREK